MADGRDTPIEELDLPVRGYNLLKRRGFETIGDILEKSEEEILAIPNFGQYQYFILREKLIANGYLRN